MNFLNSIRGTVTLSACRPVFRRAWDSNDPKEAIQLLNGIIPKLYSYPAAMADSSLLSNAVVVLVQSYCRLRQYDSALNAINEFQEFAKKTRRDHAGEWVECLESKATDYFASVKKTVTVRSALYSREKANGPLGAYEILCIQPKLGVPLKEVIQIGSPELKGSVCHQVAQYLEHLQREYGDNIPRSLKIATMESLPSAAQLGDQQSLSRLVAWFMNIVALGPEDDLYAFDLLDAMPGVRTMAARTAGMDDAHKMFVVKKLRLVNTLGQILCPASLRISDVIDTLLPNVSEGGHTYATSRSSFTRLLSKCVASNHRVPAEATARVRDMASATPKWQGMPCADDDTSVDSDVAKLLQRVWTMVDGNAVNGPAMADAFAQWSLMRRLAVL